MRLEDMYCRPSDPKSTTGQSDGHCSPSARSGLPEGAPGDGRPESGTEGNQRGAAWAR